MVRKKSFKLHSGTAYGEQAFNNEVTDGTINNNGANLIVHSRAKGREVFPKSEGNTALSVYAEISETEDIFQPLKHKN